MMTNRLNQLLAVDRGLRPGITKVVEEGNVSPKKTLITGVYGLIAGAIYRHFQAQPERYDVHALARRRKPSRRVRDSRALEIPDEKFHLADLTDFDALRRAAEGMEVVVHMAADPDPDTKWENILSSNVTGAYHTFEACRQAGVKRVIFASSVMASWGYQLDEPYKAIQESRFDQVPSEFPIVSHLDPVRPTEPYSASKVWGEALARVYADVHGLSCICLRIGWVNGADRPYLPEVSAVWCSQRDIVDLVERCVQAPEELRFDIFYGVSNNRYRWVDINHPRQVLGWVPQDRTEDFS
jgi:nucleoside-diphosphate-sugar epimerase